MLSNVKLRAAQGKNFPGATKIIYVLKILTREGGFKWSTNVWVKLKWNGKASLY